MSELKVIDLDEVKGEVKAWASAMFPCQGRTSDDGPYECTCEDECEECESYQLVVAGAARALRLVAKRLEK